MVQLFAAFAFADQESLGFDTTIQPDKDNKGQFIITIYPDNDKKNPKRLRTIQSISSYGAEPLQGRGTRVFSCVEIDGNGESFDPPVVIKDIWIDSDHRREGEILKELYEKAEDTDKQLVEKHFLTAIYQGDVWTTHDTRDDTANALMRGLNIAADHASLFPLQRKPNIQKSEPPPGSDGLRATTRVQARRGPLLIRYGHKTHYRIVFKEKGVTVDHLKSLPDVMTVLGEAVDGAFLFGSVHR